VSAFLLNVSLITAQWQLCCSGFSLVYLSEVGEIECILSLALGSDWPSTR
jgi:hypothetical protein